MHPFDLSHPALERDDSGNQHSAPETSRVSSRYGGHAHVLLGVQGFAALRTQPLHVERFHLPLLYLCIGEKCGTWKYLRSETIRSNGKQTILIRSKCWLQGDMTSEAGGKLQRKRASLCEVWLHLLTR